MTDLSAGYIGALEEECLCATGYKQESNCRKEWSEETLRSDEKKVKINFTLACHPSAIQ